MLEREDILQVIVDRYTAAEIVEVLELDSEDILDSFGDLMYNSIMAFELALRDLGLDKENMCDGKRYETSTQEEDT
tara:strand:+ start:332 stop:559 length:228 start_codon:yes stop_codon:yes gene_type:complete